MPVAAEPADPISLAPAAAAGRLPASRAQPQLGSLFVSQPSPPTRRGITVEKSYPWLLLGLDVLNVTIFFAASVVLRYEEGLVHAWSFRVYTVLLTTCCLGLYMIGGYHHRTIKQSLRYATEHLLVSAGIAAAAFIIIYAFVAYGQNMRAARTSVSLVLVGFSISSLTYRRFLDTHLRQAFTNRHIDIIGSGLLARQLRQRIRDTNWGYSVRIFSEHPSALRDDEMQADQIRGAGDLLQLPIDEWSRTEAIVLTTPPGELSAELRQHLLNAQFLHGLRVYTYDSYVRSHFRTVPIENLPGEWAFSEGFRLSHSPAFDRVKRGMDLLFSLFTLIALSPLMLAIAALVKASSRGPVFFVQERVGRLEKPFRLIKFRSMRVGSESGNAYTEDGDDRLTPIGGFLRRSHLDELPQLINVLRGEMSLVGPRAEWRRLVDDYERCIPHYHYRHLVKPGITGWAQVNYPYGLSRRDAIEKLKYDLYYVRYHSLLLDVSTLLKTAYTVVFAKGH